MKDFSGVKFKWEFREYQRRVLDNSSKYLKDKKINIVAAPGSGKTILGLELITRLKAPCIIFSPTITIRDQWQDRFQEAFLYETENINDYVSTDLHEIKLLNSITYQALHSAIDKVESEDNEEKVDYSSLDLFELINKNKITTICLDEAHHLKNEWQKALEKFIKKIDKKVTVISLTATPPYDSSKEEWNRYISICGEIDEEIHVPELVKYNTLCPHQDYVYFNFPSDEESSEFKEYKIKAYDALKALKNNAVFRKFYNTINDNGYSEGTIYKDIEGFSAILHLFLYMKLDVNKKLLSKGSIGMLARAFTLEFAEIGINYLLDSGFLAEEEKEEIVNLFKKYSLVDRGKIELSLNEKLKKKLAASIGKLDSIKEIVKSEYGALNDKLRMLILTDYIKKESINCIGSDSLLNNISIVTIFEKIRRENLGVKIGALSGGLIILPSSLEDVLYHEYRIDKDSISFKAINDSDYSSCTMKGSNKDKVNLIGKLFEDGHLQVLVGTKSLLGEGWDSPCINSLILASFVGSFMLSNQMRGRAIRIYKKDLHKVANIWHLVAIEPSYLCENGDVINNDNVITSSDYQTLQRRFDCFVGPNYEENIIESGMERLTCIKGPYTKESVEAINDKMKQLSLNRGGLKDIWINALNGDGTLTLVNVVDQRKRMPLYLPIIELMQVVVVIMLYVFIAMKFDQFSNYWYYNFFTFLFFASLIITVPVAIFKLIKFFHHVTSKNSIKTLSKALLASLQSIGVINDEAKIKIEKSINIQNYEVRILNASYKEEVLFNTSLKEFLSSNDDPRYLLICKSVFGKNDYKISYNIPSMLSKNKDTAQVVRDVINKTSFRNTIVYAKNQKEDIAKYLKNSYVIRSNEVISKQKVK